MRSRPASDVLGLAAIFAVSGVLHFARPRPYERMVPQAIAASQRELVYASGAAELVCAAGLIHPRTRSRLPRSRVRVCLSPCFRPTCRWLSMCAGVSDVGRWRRRLSGEAAAPAAHDPRCVEGLQARPLTWFGGGVGVVAFFGSDGSDGSDGGDFGVWLGLGLLTAC